MLSRTGNASVRTTEHGSRQHDRTSGSGTFRRVPTGERRPGWGPGRAERGENMATTSDDDAATPAANTTGGPINDDTLRKILSVALAAVPMILWIIYVLTAAFADHGPGQPANLDDTWQAVGTGAGTALAAVAGSFLGISVNQSQGQNRSITQDVRQGFQWPQLSISGWATIVYLLGIVIAVIAWLADGDRTTSAPVIVTSLGALAGFGLGALKAATTRTT